MQVWLNMIEPQWLTIAEIREMVPNRGREFGETVNGQCSKQLGTLIHHKFLAKLPWMFRWT